MGEKNTDFHVHLINKRRIHLYWQYQFMRKQKKELTYNTLKEWIWSVTQNLVGQSSMYKKVIFIDEHQWNELNILQMHTMFKWEHDKSVLSFHSIWTLQDLLWDKWNMGILMTFSQVQTLGDDS